MDLDALCRLLRDARARSQAVGDTIRDPLLVLDSRLCVVSANQAYLETFKVGRDETIGQLFYELGNRQWDVADLRFLLEEVIPRSISVIDYEIEADFPEIGPRTMLVSAQRLIDKNSRVLLISMIDAGERNRKDEEKDVLIGELRHRMKNVLSLVRALAHQTVATDRSGEEYRDAFLGRFDALVRAQDLSISPDRAIALADLVQTTLEPYRTDPETVAIEAGPAVSLAPAQVLPVSLILHELATNAVKYGALSTSQGRLRVDWTVVEEAGGGRHLQLWWRERGGPPLTPPASHGFGTRLIKFAATRDLGGKVQQTFAPEGLTLEVTFPL